VRDYLGLAGDVRSEISKEMSGFERHLREQLGLVRRNIRLSYHFPFINFRMRRYLDIWVLSIPPGTLTMH